MMKASKAKPAQRKGPPAAMRSSRQIAFRVLRIRSVHLFNRGQDERSPCSAYHRNDASEGVIGANLEGPARDRHKILDEVGVAGLEHGRRKIAPAELAADAGI